MAESDATVVKVIDEYRVVINKGRQDGVQEGEPFLIFEVGEELFDPASGESLGKLEIVKGRGKARHVQQRLTTLESMESERVVRRSTGVIFSWTADSETQTRELPFNDAKTGDLARSLRPRRTE